MSRSSSSSPTLCDGGEDGSLHAVRYSGKDAAGPAFVDDYAFFAEALLTLTSIVDWLDPGASADSQTRAGELAQTALERFRDSGLAGFFFTASDPGLTASALWCSAPVRCGFPGHRLLLISRWAKESPYWSATP